jgi:glycosyltransferase involved in cell wall biosynthesis
MKMKILVFSHEYPPVGGGGGRVAQNLNRGLTKLGYEIQVISTHFGDLPVRSDEDGILVHRIHCHRSEIYKASFFSMMLFVWRGFWKGLSIIRQWKPDVLHAHFAVPAGAPTWALSRLTKIPYIITAHGGDVPGAAPEKTANWFKFIMPFTHPIWNQAVRIVAVSDHFEQLARKYYPVEMEVIPNRFSVEGIQMDKLQPNQPPMIIYAGRFSPEKNPTMVVEALAKLREYDWQAVMLGDGTLMPEIQKKIEQLKLKSRIRLTGWVSEQQVQEYFSKSDILFMPSLAEGLPLSALQGLAMGLALVLSRVGGCVNLVKPGKNGFLVEPGDLKGYVDALRELLSQPNLIMRYRKASLEHAQQFQPQSVITAYDDLFMKLHPE